MLMCKSDEYIKATCQNVPAGYRHNNRGDDGAEINRGETQYECNMKTLTLMKCNEITSFLKILHCAIITSIYMQYFTLHFSSLL